jgi:SPP1 gp7 family putative phage head morphogenesis protein
VYLERLKAGYASGWQGTQRALRQRVKQVLDALDVDNLQELTRRELQRALIGLRSAMVEVTAPAMTEFLAQMPGLAAYAAGLEIASLASVVANPPRFNAPTAAMAYQAALENPVQATGEMLGTLVANWPANDAMRVSNIIQKGWGQGRTLQQMIREVVGTKAAGFKDGTLDISRRHAGAVIATATQHVANAARMEVWERNSDLVTAYQWLSTLDRRTTPQCKSLDGRTFEPGKGPMPPIHVNCRSTTVAVLGPEWDFLDAGATRASSGPNPGYVPATDNYYDWLGKQPESFQKTALGPARAKLFRDGGLTAERFAELNLGRDFEPMTLAQMREIEPDAFKLAGVGAFPGSRK